MDQPDRSTRTWSGAAGMVILDRLSATRSACCGGVKGGRAARGQRPVGGTVQTVALRRCRPRAEIEAFVPGRMDTGGALGAADGRCGVIYRRVVANRQDKRISRRKLMQRIVDDLRPAAIRRRRCGWKAATLRKNRRPDPPLPRGRCAGSSALAAFPPGLTMKLAQQLYEGVPSEAGTVGLDHLHAHRLDGGCPEAQQRHERRSSVSGASYLPASPPVYHTVKSAQEAHEAIRPFGPQRTPRRAALPRRQQAASGRDDLAAVGCQPDGRRPVRYHRPDPTARGDRPSNRLLYLFRATGRLLVFDGF